MCIIGRTLKIEWVSRYVGVRLFEKLYTYAVIPLFPCACVLGDYCE